MTTYHFLVVILDEGLTISIVNENVNRLNLIKKSTNVIIKSVGQEVLVLAVTHKVSFEIQNFTDSFKPKKLLVVRDLDYPEVKLPGEIFRLCKNKTGISVLFHEKPEISLGQDYINLIVNLKTIFLGNGNLYLSRFLLGWTIHGKFCGTISGTCSVEAVNFISDTEDRENVLHDLVLRSFDKDALGVSERPRIKDEDKRALEI